MSISDDPKDRGGESAAQTPHDAEWLEYDDDTRPAPEFGPAGAPGIPAAQGHDPAVCEEVERTYQAEAARSEEILRREYQAEIGRLRAEIKRLRTRGGIARSLIPVAQVEKFHRRCKELGV